MTLEVAVLGRAQVRVAGREVGLSGKPLALLYRLALRPATRAEATALLWGDDGAQSLRQALVVLRKLPGAETWFEDGEPLNLRGAIDSRAFEAAMQTGDTAAALALYGGRLLEGFQLARAPGFHDWLELERARFEQLLSGALRAELERLEAEQPQLALGFAERLLQLDPLDERAVQSALRLELRLSRREAAQGRLAAFRRLLRAELGAEPLAETFAILNGGLAPTMPGQGVSSLALRLARARPLALEAAHDTAFWAQVLEVDAYNLAEAAAELETAPIAPAELELPLSVRALLHRRIALCLEARFDEAAPDAAPRAAQLGRHWLAAAEVRRALPWWTRAASAALRAGRTAEAEHALYYALWITEDEPARREALVSLSSVADARNDLGLMRAIALELERLGAALQDDLTLFHAQHRLTSWLVRSARPQEALEAATEARRIAERLADPELIALAHGAAGTALMATGQLEAARGALLEAATTTNQQLRLRSLANLGSVAGMLGRLEEALSHLEAALTTSRATQNLAVTGMVLYNLGATAEKLGQLERAERGFREAVDIAQRIGNGSLLLQATLALAKVHAARGHWGAAFNTASEALELAQDSPLQPQAQYLLGELEARFGRFEAARAWYATALAGFQSAGNARLCLSLEASQALLELQRGQNDANFFLRQKLEALRDAGHVDQFDHVRLEYALHGTQAEDIRWAIAGLPEDQLPVKMARFRLRQLEAASQDTDVFAAVLEAAFAAERYAELALGYEWLAQALAAKGQADAAAMARLKAETVRLESAAGLPKTQRAAFLESQTP